jgi:SP family sugar:H+ symporter-like MFS transporter
MAWVVIGETFPLRTRAKQASLATAGNWLGNFMISFLTPLANNGISYAFGFVFVGTNIAAALLVWFFLYETRTLSLENVDKMYSTPGIKAWRSHAWVPEGYIDRKTRIDKTGQRFSDDSGTIGRVSPVEKAENGEGKGVSSQVETV